MYIQYYKLLFHNTTMSTTNTNDARYILDVTTRKNFNTSAVLSINGGLSLSDESFPNGGARGAFAKPSRSVSSRRLRGASKAPPRTLRGGLRTLRGGCTYRRLHEDALEGSRGLLEGSVDELHVPTRS